MIGRTNVSGGKNDYSKMIEMYGLGPVLPLKTTREPGNIYYKVKTRRVAHMVDDYYGIPVLGGFSEPLTYTEYSATYKLNRTGHTSSMYSSDVTEDSLFRSYEHPSYYTYSEIEEQEGKDQAQALNSENFMNSEQLNGFVFINSINSKLFSL